MKTTKTNKQEGLEPIEKKLWEAANSLRKNIDAAEYKHVVLGLIFLKYVSDSFEELRSKLDSKDQEDRNEYKCKNVFFVPNNARWFCIRSKAKQPDIGKIIDDAMDEIEKENESLKGVLPKVFSRGNLDPISLGKLIDVFSNIDIASAKNHSSDILGHVFEYFLGEFALDEGRKGGEFYTPRSVVQLLVEMLEPFKGRVFDPCCGSGGMFVQSEKFIKEHQGKVENISIYGQESNQTTWRLAKMNLAMRHIESDNVKWNNEGSFLNDAHKRGSDKGLDADYIIANPPFNVSDWSGDLLKNDSRWKYGVPPRGNANYAWIQHFLYHLSENGHAGFVLSKGALTSKSAGEGEIRKKIIEERLVDCIVNLPAKLFLNTQIPASLWFLRKRKSYRKDEILFIDASNLGHLINRRTRELSDSDIRKIADTYHKWKSEKDGYNDIKGFCKTATIDEVAKLDYVLIPGRYVGPEDVEYDFDFAERFMSLQKEFEEQIKEEAELNKKIVENLAKIKVGGTEK